METERAKVRTSMEFWSPKRAQSALEATQYNPRKLRQSHVSFLAKAMESGNWLQGTSMIMIDEDGNIIDGQHRLSAIIQSGHGQQFVTVRGHSRDNAKFVDGDMSMRAAHVRLGTTSTITAIARSLSKYSPRPTESVIPTLTTDKLSTAELEEIYTEFEKEFNKVIKWSSKGNKSVDAATKGVCVRALRYHRGNREGQETVRGFLRYLATGVDQLDIFTRKELGLLAKYRDRVINNQVNSEMSRLARTKEVEHILFKLISGTDVGTVLRFGTKRQFVI